ncbi:hypothetical protein SAMN05519103_09099 [Rhizobiales bacterium GAS113]|nr:hypothetical protein SAMN05519103_09099 [Rhizobiales bacterium GAS113]
MKKALVAPLATLCLLAGLIAFSSTEASAVVCAKGVVRAGCAGPRGAAVVHRGVVAPRRGVVIRR